MLKRGLAVAALLGFMTTFISAERFYADPVNGSMAGDGSIDSPWSTFDSVWAAGKFESFYGARPYAYGDSLTVTRNAGAPISGGDTLMLMTGYHGDVATPYGYYNKEFITIMNAPGHTPRMKRFNMNSCCRWRFVGISFSPSFEPGWQMDTLSHGTCLSLAGHGYNGPAYENEAIACTVFTEWDASGWTQTMWTKGACGSIGLTSRSVVRNCVMKNVINGPFCSGDSMLIEGNLLESFRQDGLRMAGTGNVLQYNILKNCMNVDGNHDDAIQCYPSCDYGVVRGNIIIEFDFSQNDWGATDTASRPFSGPLQGIFGGPWNNSLIENNLVVVDHWHGISVYGDSTENNRIINNTVIDLVPGNERVPWIQNFGSGTGHITRNNVGYSIGGAGTKDHNFSIGSTPLADLFEDPDNFDFRPKAGSVLIDSGSADQAPDVDQAKVSRPQGAGIDIGAYEYAVSGLFGRPAAPSSALLRNIPNPLTAAALARIAADRGLSVFHTDGKPVSVPERIVAGYYFVGTADGARVPVMVVE